MKSPVLDLTLTGPKFHPGVPRTVKLDGLEIPGVRTVTIKANPGDVAVALIEVVVGDVIVTRIEEEVECPSLPQDGL